MATSTTSGEASMGPVLFWREFEEPYGFLSQWYESPFEVDGVTYQTAEMWMMVQKAKLFGDEVCLQEERYLLFQSLCKAGYCSADDADHRSERASSPGKKSQRYGPPRELEPATLKLLYDIRTSSQLPELLCSPRHADSLASSFRFRSQEVG